MNRNTFALLLALSLACSAKAAAPADAIFREAEEFKTIEKGWFVAPHSNSGYRGMPSGGKLVRGFQSALGTLGDTFNAPAAATYKLHFRYLDLSAASLRNEIAFKLTVTQNGKTVAEKIFDDGDSLRATPEGKKQWGNGWAEFVWGSLDCPLEAGEFTVAFTKLHRRDTTGLARNIDCIVITADAAYLPDLKDFEKTAENPAETPVEKNTGKQ